jgi:glycosyltransferase involved in cell wall biosynthesis
MKILIVNHEWNKSWMPLFAGEFEKYGDVIVWDGNGTAPDIEPDLVFYTWADRDFTQSFPKARHVMMMRRFEFFHADWPQYNWNKIDLLITCNVWIGEQVAQAIKKTGTAVACVRNPIDPSLWAYRKRSHGKKIGMACRIFPVKNLPLAVQIMHMLPKEYELHIAGPIHDYNVMAYMTNALPKERLFIYGDLERSSLDSWWEDKNYCLSTSISEGDPMAVLEAMAKGIKPVIHNWPGADEFYNTFTRVSEACSQILAGEYDSEKYRKTVIENNPVENIKYIVEQSIKEIGNV